MLNNILTGYGIFILEILTLILVIALVVTVIVSLKHKKQVSAGELQITDLAKVYRENSQKLKRFRLSEVAKKTQKKQEKVAKKQQEKQEKQKAKESLLEPQASSPCVYVIDFKGDIHASATDALREEISAILQVANPKTDEVLLRLESPGGVVHGYGFAASQLKRLRDKEILLTVAVDKVAASGGYMMACVANKIISAPFAILGSIGVVAQIPNIHRLLKKHEVDVDVMTAGEYKRTVTLLGENTEQGKRKFQQELEETHELFKAFVAENRPQVKLEQVATGEHWYGQQAIDLALVDELSTSDDAILNAIINKKEVLLVNYQQKKSFAQKLGKQAEESVDNVLMRWLKQDTSHFL